MGNLRTNSLVNPFVGDYEMMTVVIDQDDPNPETCVYYQNDAKNMIPGSAAWDDWIGARPCMLKDGVEVGTLDPNDFSKYADGTSADITSGNEGDVMSCFPRKGIRISNVGNCIVTDVTNAPNAKGFEYCAHRRGNNQKDNFYLGAYGGYVLNNKLRSLSGKDHTVNKTVTDFRTAAQAMGTGYDLMAYYQLVFIQVMYLLKYKNLNSQAMAGMGLTNAPDYLPSGGTDQKGMCWGDPNAGTSQHKLFGVEDLWGNHHTVIDGVLKTGNSTKIMTASTGFNNTGSDYITVEANAPTTTISAGDTTWLQRTSGTTLSGFWPIKPSTTGPTERYCNTMNNVGGDTTKHPIYIGGNKINGASGGIYYIGQLQSVSSASSDLGARLMYL